MPKEGATEASRAGWLATLTATVMIAAFVGSKATRDALFLDVFSAAELPKAMLASAVLSVFGVAAMARALSAFGPQKLVPALFVVSGAGFAGEWVLVESSPKAASAVIYLHVAVLSSLLISGFWSVVTERFDPHTAKKIVSRITAGSTSGGLIGGILASRVAVYLDTRAMLLFLAGMSVVCGVGVFALGSSNRDDAREDAGGIFAGLGFLRRTPYLRLLAGLVVLIALTSGLIDYAFKAEAAANFTAREELMSFFAIFYTVTGLVTFAAQTLLSRRALAKLGIGGTIALLPGAVLLGSAVGAAFTRLWTVVVVRGVQNTLENSLYTSGYQLLFTPLTPEQKRPTKTLIDVGFDRLGGAIGSGLIMVAVAVESASATRASLIGAGVAGLIALFLAARLHRGYIAELAKSLELGRVQLAEDDIIDATTRRTLADTTMAMNRDQLLAEIEELRQNSIPPPDKPSPTLVSASEEEDAKKPEAAELGEGHPLREALSDLTSDEPARIRRALKPPLPTDLVAFAIPHLGRDDVARTARRVLRQAAPRVVGQLVDALLDDDLDSTVRRRLPEVVASVANQRAAVGLFAALRVEEDEVRERAARALSDMGRQHPELVPAESEVFDVVRLELQRTAIWLPRVFMLLELALPRDPLRLALSALRSEDGNLRGTAYEYLENVLPDDIRKTIWPHLHAFAGAEQPRRGSKAPRRSQKQLLAALQQSSDALEIDQLELVGRSDSLD